MKEKRLTNKKKGFTGKTLNYLDLPRFNRFVDEILQKRTASQKTDGGLSNE